MSSHHREAERRLYLMTIDPPQYDWISSIHPSHTVTTAHGLDVYPALVGIGGWPGCLDCRKLYGAGELRDPCPAAAERKRADDAAQLRRIADALERMNGRLEELLHATIAAPKVTT